MLRASHAQENVNPCADFADTVARKVREETGVVAELGAVYKLAAQSPQKMRPSRWTREGCLTRRG